MKDTGRTVLVSLPYIEGLSEELSRTFKAHRVDKPSNTLCQLLCSPKDPAKEGTSGVIYHIHCDGNNMDSSYRSTYIGGTGRMLKTRFAEHRQPSTRTSKVLQHLHLQGRQKHQVSLDSARILHRKAHEDRRGISVCT